MNTDVRVIVKQLLCSAFTVDPSAERIAMTEERERLIREIENLTKGIASGGDIPALAAALAERDKRLKFVQSKLAQPIEFPDRDALKAALELRTADWRNILRSKHVAQARLVLQHLLDLPVRSRSARLKG